MDDAWLPFVIAARAGDEAAERELLLRVCPVVLEVLRTHLLAPAGEHTRLALDALVMTLKALPSIRGDEVMARVVAQIALECARRAGYAQDVAEAPLFAAAERRARRGARAGDVLRIASLVEAALTDDAAVLISHIITHKTPSRKSWPYIVAGVLALAASGFVGYLLTRTRG